MGWKMGSSWGRHNIEHLFYIVKRQFFQNIRTGINPRANQLNPTALKGAVRKSARMRIESALAGLSFERGRLSCAPKGVRPCGDGI